MLSFIMLLFSFYANGQMQNEKLTAELYEKEFPVLRSFKNKRLAEIEALRDRMLLVPPKTEKGAKLWRAFLDFNRNSLISFPLDTYDKDDEEYWNRISATLIPLFYVCCDQLEGREKEAYNNALTLKNFLYYGYRHKEIRQTTWKDVQAMLDEDDVAIELRVMPDEALILRKGTDSPVSVPIDSVLVEKLGMFKGVDAVEISEMYSPGGVLSKLWAALSPSIAGAKHIYLSASHFLCNFNYGAIPTINGSTVDDDYDFHYLASTEVIRSVKERKETSEYKSAILFGDITYDMNGEKMKASASRQDCGQKTVWDLTRGMDEATRGKLLPLQHSKEEILAINNLLREKGIEVMTFSADSATEATFKTAIRHHPAIIHLSTHGFMLAPVYCDSDEAPIYPESQAASKYATCMLKSGLLLSGASRAWNGKTPIEGVEDGILTTKELLEMDLRGTKLAVLSACKTGLGNDTNLTGLSFGPQHALKTKGVEQIVMSLWMVDDAATTLLMKRFYEALLTGIGVKHALKQAQRRLKEEGYNDPYFWASFIVFE